MAKDAQVDSEVAVAGGVSQRLDVFEQYPSALYILSVQVANKKPFIKKIIED